MKKIVLLVLLLPLLGFGQTKNVMSAFKVFPKVDKGQEFEKAFAAHAQKYHTGDWKWRVYEVQSGPDYGSFMVVEGPLSWDQFDKRGNLGAEHTADWAKNVAPLITDRGVSSYSEFHADMSTVQVTDYADKIMINHVLPKPGYVGGVMNQAMKLKGVWSARNESVAVYTLTGSGDPEIVQVRRFKNGLKEMDDANSKSMKDSFEGVHGAGSWDYFLSDYSKFVERRWSELLMLRADLGSK